jgi:DNA-binding beta-propeller fold protein YncE
VVHRTYRSGVLALALSCLASIALAESAGAARTVYFADPVADEIAQYTVAPGGGLMALEPRVVEGDDAGRLAMTPEGEDLYAASDHGVLQYDVATDGRLAPKSPGLQPAPGDPHSIAVHPGGGSVYVTDDRLGRVRQYGVRPDGRLVPKDPASLFAGPVAKGVAVSPDGATAYVLVLGGIAVFDVEAGGALRSREVVPVRSRTLQDVALTPNGKNLYATSRDGRVLQFDVDESGTPTAKSTPAVDVGPCLRPIGIAITPDGSAAYVSTQAWGGRSRRVFGFAIGAGGALTAASNRAVAARRLWYLTASPDGRSLFVAGGDGHLFDIGPLASLAAKAPASVDLAHAVGVVVSPNQAPVASFTVSTSPATAGAPTAFNASAAADPDGSIVRYDWDFGDGTLLPNGGPTPTHVYSRPGTYIARLVVTDNEGASTGTIFTGGTVSGFGGPRAQATRSIVVAAAAAAAPGAPPAPPILPGQTPLPDLGRSLLAEAVRGRVRVRLPGEDRFRRLEELEEIPVGSTLDTRRGRVELTAVRDRRRTRLQRGIFYGGLFKVRQRARDRYVTELLLQGLLSCPTGRRSRARGEGDQVVASRRKRRRRLWGSGRGRFRSRGRYSSATVRGTRWLVEDRCRSTVTLVRSGRVVVRDFVRDRRVVLRRGQRYVARARRR